MRAASIGCEPMATEYLLGLIVSALLLAYLVYALVKPERF
jgi:K+-transporting ATPase KdpF subunit